MESLVTLLLNPTQSTTDSLRRLTFGVDGASRPGSVMEFQLKELRATLSRGTRRGGIPDYHGHIVSPRSGRSGRHHSAWWHNMSHLIGTKPLPKELDVLLIAARKDYANVTGDSALGLNAECPVRLGWHPDAPGEFAGVPVTTVLQACVDQGHRGHEEGCNSDKKQDKFRFVHASEPTQNEKAPSYGNS